MGELIVLSTVIVSYLIIVAVCLAGATHQKKSAFLTALSFVPVLNIIIALQYIRVFMRVFNAEVGKVAADEENGPEPARDSQPNTPAGSNDLKSGDL